MIKYTLSLYVNRKTGQKWPYPVYISVFRAKKRFFVSTGLNCETDIVGRSFADNEPLKKFKDKTLNQMLIDAEAICLDASNETGNDELKARIMEAVRGVVPDSKKPKTFLQYFDEFVSTKTVPGTIRTYEGTRRKILAYDKNVKLEQIDKKWLTDFQNENMKDGKMCYNGIAIHLRNIRAVFNYCIDQEYTDYYPFRRFSIKHEETRKRALSVEDLRIMVSMDLSNSWQEPYRDIFLLMVYLMGINASDLFGLPANAIKRNRIQYRRNKTGRLFDISVPPEAMQIIRKWKGKNHLIYPLDDYRTVNDYLHHFNAALKSLGVRYEGYKLMDRKKGRGGSIDDSKRLWPELSSYWSRHTFATLAAELEIPRETIGACLGHSYSTVTDIYIKFNTKKVDEAQKKVIGYILGK